MINRKLPPPNLLVPRTEALQKIQEQIYKGNEFIHIQTDDFESMAQAYSDRTKWVNYNAELLLRLFDNSSMADEYINMFDREWSKLDYIKIINRDEKYRNREDIPYQIKQVQSQLGEQIEYLESICERLNLIPEKINAGVFSHSQNAQGYDVFLVHGHNDAVKESVSRFIEKLGFKVIILHEQPNAGRTIIEKFENYSNVGFAIVLLTPDDIGATYSKSPKAKPRARQNVILELGYFIAKLGRQRVCALYKEEVELPSDINGLLYVPLDDVGAWRLLLAKEMKHAGFPLDLNKI